MGERTRGSLAAAVLLVALCLALLPATARPALAEGASASAIRVFQRLGYPEGTSGLRRTWSYRLERVTPGAPMPEGSEGDAYGWEMEGDDEASIKIPAPDAPGDYRYRMGQVLPDGLEAGYSTDGTTYDVLVRVAADGSEAAVLYGPDGEKVADPGWTVTYSAPTPAPSRPSGIMGAIVSALPGTGDVAWAAVGAAAALAVVGTCTLALGRAASRRRAAADAKGGRHEEIH